MDFCFIFVIICQIKNTDVYFLEWSYEHLLCCSMFFLQTILKYRCSHLVHDSHPSKTWNSKYNFDFMNEKPLKVCTEDL